MRHIDSSKIVPCGNRFSNLIGQKFTRLSVVSLVGKIIAPSGKGASAVWKCLCDCGGVVDVLAASLKSGNTKSCGCLVREATGRVKHGMILSPEYYVWAKMLNRCRSSSNKQWKDYGGRGIKVCQEWEQFENFYADMGARPSPKHTIERIDCNGDYAIGNCCWATMKEQGRNRRDNRRVTFQGQTLCVSAWSEKLGIPEKCIYYRLDSGWPVERALTEPVHVCNSR